MKITGRKFGLVLLLFILVFSACKKEEVIITSLPRSNPEAEGVSSQGIIDFLDAAAESKHEFHSFMFLRHGKVIAEGWWDPYRPDLKHTLYSTSKSFTATAIGLAVSEKKLALHDKVISFFPDDMPDTVSALLSDMTVRDLLSMTAGQEPDPTFGVVSKDSNWVKGFLNVPVIHDPGTKFLYNSLATYMLSAIVQKVTGEKVVDYLKPRLFTPLSIDGMDWEVDPRGINTGGWGLRLKTEDMAKFGQLFIQKGKWNGKQVLPETWIDEASSAKIDQAPDAPRSKKDSSDWMQGYCYQMWRCRNNAFRADGAYGQFIIMIPDKDAVIAITAETPDMQDEINLVWKYLYPAIKPEKLAGDANVSSALEQKLSSLALPVPATGNISPDVTKISDKTFVFKPNDKNVQSMGFHFMGDMAHLTLKIDTTLYRFAFGSGKWMEGETTMTGPNLVQGAKAHFTGLPPVKVEGSYRWKDDKTLELELRFVESPHTQKMTCTFDQTKVRVSFSYSNAPDAVEPELTGEILK